jgi:hypothetical protein
VNTTVFLYCLLSNSSEEVVKGTFKLHLFTTPVDLIKESGAIRIRQHVKFALGAKVDCVPHVPWTRVWHKGMARPRAPGGFPIICCAQ